MPLSETPNAQAYREFMATDCAVCGHKKQVKMSFCRDCYFKLDKTMRQNLYRRFGAGYEEAHIEARDFLIQERRARG